jgi:hypothetical protein
MQQRMESRTRSACYFSQSPDLEAELIATATSDAPREYDETTRCALGQIIDTSRWEKQIVIRKSDTRLARRAITILGNCHNGKKGPLSSFLLLTAPWPVFLP